MHFKRPEKSCITKNQATPIVYIACNMADTRFYLGAIYTNKIKNKPLPTKIDIYILVL